ncbi:MAG: HemK family protein methyltransferase, partial [Proteobacteria bacterium]|nr:HemK family protein methyltransferase [Pseudomonadota bacterium]
GAGATASGKGAVPFEVAPHATATVDDDHDVGNDPVRRNRQLSTHRAIARAHATVAEHRHAPDVIVNLCSGSGNLALALAATFPDACTYAVDISTHACEVALENAERNGLAIEVLEGDLFEPLPPQIEGHIDLLVANPPYIGALEMGDLPRDVLREPGMALLGGERGDEIVERIAIDASRWLAPGGLVFCEISEFASDRTLAHFRHLGAEIHHDLAGRPRFIVGRRS